MADGSHPKNWKITVSQKLLADLDKILHDGAKRDILYFQFW